MPIQLLRFELLLPAFGLVVARVAGLVVGAPMFSSSQIPGLVKALVVAALSFLAFPIVVGTLPASLSVSQALVGMAGEFLIGEMLGLAAGVVFFAAQMAGKIISYQAGFTLGQVVNPLFDEEFAMIDQLLFFSAFMVFLALGGHLAVVSVLLGSFHKVPPLTLMVDGSLADFALGLLESMFDVAFRLAGPTVLALLLSSLVLGFLAKTMPQMNILSVGFGAKIGVALIVTALTIASADGLLAQAIGDSLADMNALFDHLEGLAHGS